MLTLEDCLEALDSINWNPPVTATGKSEILNTWDRRFISDVTYHVREGKPLSTGQGSLALKLITRYRSCLVAYGISDAQLTQMLATPIYRQIPFASTTLPREVRWAGDNLLAFRCKYNAVIKEELKKLADGATHSRVPKFNQAHKLWVVEVHNSV